MVHQRQAYQSSIIKNQQGLSSSIAPLMILFLSTLLIIHLYILSSNYKKQVIYEKDLICIKSFYIFQNTFFQNIESKNKIIQTLNKIQVISLAIPGYGISAGMSSKKAKKMIQMAQEADYVLFVKKLLHLKAKKCSISISQTKSFYQRAPLGFKRSEDGLTQYYKKERKDLWESTLNSFSILNKIGEDRLLLKIY
jgi:hypothetical protein